jgi:hypothetical protein
MKFTSKRIANSSWRASEFSYLLVLFYFQSLHKKSADSQFLTDEELWDLYPVISAVFFIFETLSAGLLYPSAC